MKREININLPNHSGYQELQLSAKPSDSYEPGETADGMGELLEYLYRNMPKVVVDRLVKDPRVVNFRRILEDKV